MALKLTYNNPGMPKGEEVSIHGLGLFENGKSGEISEEQEASCLAATGLTVKELVKDDENVKVEGSASVSAPAAPSAKSEPSEDKGGEN